MKVAVITVVVEDAIHEQKVLQAKTVKSLRTSVEAELPKIIKQFHIDNDYCEEEDDQYIADIVEDIMSGDDIFCASDYKGSGFVQVKYF